MTTGTLSELTNLMLKSLAYEPAKLEDLIKREFIQKNHCGMDERSAWGLLNARSEYWFEDKNEVFHIYSSKKKEVLSDSFA